MYLCEWVWQSEIIYYYSVCFREICFTIIENRARVSIYRCSYHFLSSCCTLLYTFRDLEPHPVSSWFRIVLYHKIFNEFGNNTNQITTLAANKTHLNEFLFASQKIDIHSWQKRLLHAGMMCLFVFISISSVREVKGQVVWCNMMFSMYLMPYFFILLCFVSFDDIWW